MDTFRTLVQVKLYPVKMNYESEILTFGSCFAENIGAKMLNAYFKTEINPFGVLYNPMSILNSLNDLMCNKRFNIDDLFEYKSLWHSFSHSSVFSNSNSSACLEKINERTQIASQFLKNADFLVITFGTAWIFEDKKKGTIVSNCHKLPSEFFQRRRLTVSEIVDGYIELFSKLLELNPALKIVFTVSPIRHWKDGAHENSLSKGILLLAVDQLQKQFENVFYFPAFEIQMDDLRDYRFYASDMLHPSDVALDYIWEQFSKAFLSNETLQIKKQLEKLNTDLSHRPLHPESEEFEQFRVNIEKRKFSIVNQYPFLADRIS